MASPFGFINALTGRVGLCVRRALRALRGEAGFTLTELLTVLVILGIILAGLTSVFVSASTAEIDMNRRFQAQQNARLAVDKLRREIHCASAVTVTAADIELTLPTSCPTGSGTVTWCTRAFSTYRSQLFRVAGSTCAGGTLYADYLVSGSVFSSLVPTTGSGQLSKLRADLQVDLTPGTTGTATVGRYRLADDIVLRNSTRA